MKKSILLSSAILVHFVVLSQDLRLEENQVRVYLPGSDSSFLMNSIDLIGTWRNICSTSPIFDSNVPQATLEINIGHLVRVSDAWKEDYPNKLRNCTWKLVGNEMQFSSPDLGTIKVGFEKVNNKSRHFELTFNGYTYRKLVNIIPTN